MIDLNELAREIFEDNKRKGFWPKAHNCHHEEPHVCGFGVCDFIGRNPYEVLALIHSEVSEALEAMRDGKWEQSVSWHGTNNVVNPGNLIFDDGKFWLRVKGSVELREVRDEEMRAWGYIAKPEGVASELADVIIRVLDACGAWGIDIEKTIQEKVEYNATRPHKHGRKA